MYYSLKILQFPLILLLSLLLGFTFFPPLSSGGIDLQQAGSALTVKNGSQRLIDTAVSGNPAYSFAIIENVADGRQWIYREGDQVGTALIKKILPDQIIVDNGSGEEVVQLQRSLKGQAAGSSGITSSIVAAVKPRHDPTQKGGLRDRYYLINGEVFAQTFATTEQVQNLVDIHPGNLFGQHKGVRLGDFAPESLFAAFGLRKGDLLLAVNGQEVADPSAAIPMLQTMLADGQAELKVRRRARTYRFHLQAE